VAIQWGSQQHFKCIWQLYAAAPLGHLAWCCIVQVTAQTIIAQQHACSATASSGCE
jgi:hypothetical protein